MATDNVRTKSDIGKKFPKELLKHELEESRDFRSDHTKYNEKFWQGGESGVSGTGTGAYTPDMIGSRR